LRLESRLGDLLDTDHLKERPFVAEALCGINFAPSGAFTPILDKVFGSVSFRGREAVEMAGDWGAAGAAEPLSGCGFSAALRAGNTQACATVLAEL